MRTPLLLVERPQTCFELCRSLFGLFFVVSRGDKCICGFHESTSDLVTGTCDNPCAGDGSSTCGGDDAYELYQLLDEPSESESPPPADDGELGSIFGPLGVFRIGEMAMIVGYVEPGGSARAPEDIKCIAGNMQDIQR